MTARTTLVTISSALAGFLTFSLVSCGVSQEESNAQLSQHMKAYSSLTITKGNAPSVVKSADLLLSRQESNNFRKLLSMSQEQTLNNARNEAAQLIECMSIIRNSKKGYPSGTDWKQGKPADFTSGEWKTKLENLKGIDTCNNRVNELNSAQQTQLQSLIRQSSKSYEQQLRAEKAKEESEAKAAREREAAETARRQAEEAAAASKYNEAKEMCVVILGSVLAQKPGLNHYDALSITGRYLQKRGYPQLENKDRRDCRIAVYGG